MGWQKLPTVIEELDCVKQRLDEIKRASGPRCKTLMTVGNHDSRFDRRLATEVAQFEDVPGMRLSDHLRGLAHELLGSYQRVDRPRICSAQY